MKSDHSEQEDKHQFTGTSAPASLHFAVEEGRISALAAWLAMIIAAFTYGRLGKCFANNAFLAKKLNKKERQIRRLLQSLREEGFLKVKYESYKGRSRRILCITWLKVPVKKVMTAPVKNDHPDDGCPVKNDHPRPVKNDRVGKVDFSSNGRGNKANGAQKTGPNTNSMNKDSHSEEFESLSPPAFEFGAGAPPANGVGDGTGMKLAKELFGILERHGKITSRPNLSKWTKEFTMLLEHVEKGRITRVLHWYGEHLEEEYVPMCFSASSFRGKFPALETIMNRKSPGEAPAPATNGTKDRPRPRGHRGDIPD